MKKKFFLVAIICFFIPYTYAQYSFRNTLREEFKLKPRLLLGFDNKRSFIGNKGVQILGMRAGLKYNKLRLFIGLYSTIKSVSFQKINKIDTTFIKSSFGYMSIGFEYSFYRRKHWEMAFNSQLGFGGGYKLITKKGETTLESLRIIPLELGIVFSYYLKDWIAVFAGTGFRVSIYSSSEFDGLFFPFGIKILPNMIYKKTFKGL